MSKPQHIYTLDDGQKVTANMVASEVGISKNAAYGRLRGTSDQRKIFAKKNELVGHFYTANNKLKTLLAKEKREKERGSEIPAKSLEQFIIDNKPFYNDPFYKLPLMVIGCTN